MDSLHQDQLATRPLEEELEGIRGKVLQMGGLVKGILGKVLDAFARTDVRTAMDVAQADRRVDLKYKLITRQLMTHMAENSAAIPTFMKLLWAARAMERVGDRCQNIAEYVIYLVLGKDVRHTGLDEMDSEIESDRIARRKKRAGLTGPFRWLLRQA